MCNCPSARAFVESHCPYIPSSGCRKLPFLLGCHSLLVLLSPRAECPAHFVRRDPGQAPAYTASFPVNVAMPHAQLVDLNTAQRQDVDVARGRRRGRALAWMGSWMGKAPLVSWVRSTRSQRKLVSELKIYLRIPAFQQFSSVCAYFALNSSKAGQCLGSNILLRGRTMVLQDLSAFGVLYPIQ